MVRHSHARIFLGALALAAAACGGESKAPIQPPTVPDAIKAPAAEKVIARFKGVGAQVYTCKTTTSTGTTYAWSLLGPDAMLLDPDSGAVEGSHSVGPTWKSNDGSSVVGSVVAKAASPDGAIPWLLLKAASHNGTGLFSDVTSIQRVDTTGGVAPTSGCDASSSGTQSRSDYTATYYFYSN
jgi:hypothetical protein